jgi:polysaccharide export outer membrane protein
MEAIANAEITITGNRKAVTIIRKSPTGVQMHDLDLTDINVMNSPYFYLQPNDYIYIKPSNKKLGELENGIESLELLYCCSLAFSSYLKLRDQKMLDIKDFSILKTRLV